jgi:hypothetical protein
LADLEHPLSEDRSALAPDEEPAPTRWAELDLRSLALARVALGLFVFLTVALMAGDTTAFFTDAGVLPREVLVRSSFADLWLCFHMGSGGLGTPLVLNGLLAALAVGLMLGWRTPWMVLGCWVLLNSLQARNPFLGDRGDLELVLVLFWCLFLPLGGRWSLDARAGRAPFGSPRGMAAAALVLQFVMLYLFAAYLKNGPFWLGRGDALWHSLVSPLFATPLAMALSQAPFQLLKTGTYGVIAGEYFVAFLLLSPSSVPLLRGLAVALLLIFHLAVGLLFQLGLFPWLGGLLPLALLPREFWESGWGRRCQGALDRRLGGMELAEAPPSRRREGLRAGFLGCCVALALLSNLLTTPFARGWSLPRPLLGAADALRLTQHWDLFSPIPPYCGWFELTTSDAQGAVSRTLFLGPPGGPQGEAQPPGAGKFPSHRWRMLMIASLYSDFAVIRPGLATALAARAGESGASPLEYRFIVRLPDDQGVLGEPVEWKLWFRGQPENSPSAGSEQGDS